MNFLSNPLYHTRGSKPLFYPKIIDILWDSSDLEELFSVILRKLMPLGKYCRKSPLLFSFVIIWYGFDPFILQIHTKGRGAFLYHVTRCIIVFLLLELSKTIDYQYKSNRQIEKILTRGMEAKTVLLQSACIRQEIRWKPRTRLSPNSSMELYSFFLQHI